MTRALPRAEGEVYRVTRHMGSLSSSSSGGSVQDLGTRPWGKRQSWKLGAMG